MQLECVCECVSLALTMVHTAVLTMVYFVTNLEFPISVSVAMPVLGALTYHTYNLAFLSYLFVAVCTCMFAHVN